MKSCHSDQINQQLTAQRHTGAAKKRQAPMLAQGDLAGALKSDDDNLAIRERLANPTPATSVTCRWSRTTLPRALKSYNDSLAIADRLANCAAIHRGKAARLRKLLMHCDRAKRSLLSGQRCRLRPPCGRTTLAGSNGRSQS